MQNTEPEPTYSFNFVVCARPLRSRMAKDVNISSISMAGVPGMELETNLNIKVRDKVRRRVQP